MKPKRSAFKKGQPRPANAGRKPGTPNKATLFNREFIQLLLDNNAENIRNAFERVLQKDPKVGLRLAADLCEYTTPKLARVETTMTVRKELRDFTDDEIIALLTERNAQRHQPREVGEPMAGSARH